MQLKGYIVLGFLFLTAALVIAMVLYLQRKIPPKDENRHPGEYEPRKYPWRSLR